VVYSDQEYYPDHPAAAILSRTDNPAIKTYSFFNKGGVDIFLSYLWRDYTDPDDVDLKLMFFGFNQALGFENSWIGPLEIEDEDTVVSHALASVYSAVASGSLSGDNRPSVYISYVKNSSSSSSIYCQKYQVGHDNECIGGSGGDHNLCLDISGGASYFYQAPQDCWIISTDIEVLKWTIGKTTYTVVQICWDERDSSDDYSIKVANNSLVSVLQEDGTYDLTYYKSSGAVTLISGIHSDVDLSPKIDGVYRDDAKLDPRFIVCWRKRAVLHDSIWAIGYQVDENGENHQISQQALQMQEQDPRQYQIHPEMLMNRLNLNIGTGDAVWQSYDATGSEYIMAQSVTFASESSVNLQLGENYAVELHNQTDINSYAAAIDNAFYRPQGISYDHTNDRLVYCDRGNHRVGIFDDPYPSTAGCWYSELHHHDPPGLEHITTQISRYLDSGGGDYLEVGQQIWLATGYTRTTPIILKGYNTDKTMIRETEIDSEDGTPPSLDIRDLVIATDDYSSAVMFANLELSNGNVIVWNPDALFYRIVDQEIEPDRFHFPYDVSVIPPVWTSTPTPTPEFGTFTPVITSTPRTDGYWVADMASNRLMRMTYQDQAIAQTFASTHTPSPTPTPTPTGTWEATPQEHPAPTSLAAPLSDDTVMSPYAVSSAYDGSCWAIDWGREAVVKINPDGSEAARSTPCALTSTENCIKHPSALDCGGDPDTCFVADYEGNTVYKVTFDHSGNFSYTKSAAEYFRPNAVKVLHTPNGDFIWVADRINLNNTPIPGTWTPYTPPPTATPTPPSGVTYTPGPATFTPTPYPERCRVSMNNFGQEQLLYPNGAAIPISISADGDSVNGNCWVADRDAGKLEDDKHKNEIKQIKVTGGSDTLIHVSGTQDELVSRPADVESVSQ